MNTLYYLNLVLLKMAEILLFPIMHCGNTKYVTSYPVHYKRHFISGLLLLNFRRTKIRLLFSFSLDQKKERNVLYEVFCPSGVSL